MKNSKVVLPIEINASITSECWTYHKLSIIECSPDAVSWLASHINLYFDKNFNMYFGKYEDTFHLDYFNEILFYEEIPINKIDPDKIVELLISEIGNGNYVVVYLPQSKLTIHEVVFYGFDKDRKLLFYNDLVNGKFSKTSISFDDFKKCHDKVYDYFKRHPFSRTIVSWYFFPITRLRLKKFSDDLCLLKAISNLSREANGKKVLFSQFDLDGKTTESYTHYTGLGCIKGFEARLYEYIRDQRFIKEDIFRDLSKQLINTLFKIYEYSNLIVKSMTWISSELKNDVILHKEILMIKHITYQIKTLYHLAIKFNKTENWRDFYQLYEEYKNIYIPYRNSLEKFCERSNELLYLEQKI